MKFKFCAIIIVLISTLSFAGKARAPFTCRYSMDKSNSQPGWQPAGTMFYGDHRKVSASNAQGYVIYSESSPKGGACASGEKIDEDQNFTFTFFKQTAASDFNMIDGQSCKATGKNLNTSKVSRTIKPGTWAAIEFLNYLNNENVPTRLAVYMPLSDEEVDSSSDKICSKILEQMNKNAPKMEGSLLAAPEVKPSAVQ